MLPPCSSTRRFTMFSPRPVPAYFEFFPRTNGSKICVACISSSIPHPVSDTATPTMSMWVRAAATLMFPLVVNLAALLSRFPMIWWMRASSPTTVPRLSGNTITSFTSSVHKLLISCIASVSTALRSTGDCLISRKEVALSLALSRRSLVMRRRRLLLLLMSSRWSVTSFAIGPELPASRAVVSPMVALRGVRSSCVVRAMRLSFSRAISRASWSVARLCELSSESRQFTFPSTCVNANVARARRNMEHRFVCVAEMVPAPYSAALMGRATEVASITPCAHTSALPTSWDPLLRTRDMARCRKKLMNTLRAIARPSAAPFTTPVLSPCKSSQTTIPATARTAFGTSAKTLVSLENQICSSIAGIVNSHTRCCSTYTLRPSADDIGGRTLRSSSRQAVTTVVERYSDRLCCTRLLLDESISIVKTSLTALKLKPERMTVFAASRTSGFSTIGEALLSLGNTAPSAKHTPRNAEKPVMQHPERTRRWFRDTRPSTSSNSRSFGPCDDDVCDELLRLSLFFSILLCPFSFSLNAANTFKFSP
mmetsp:Transcript_20706/g.45359  ORF Transcript_20706/g.45359 Transcript_20706/m.45359 type:complete len:539 (+) Transcript_20706:140-1756(+)